MATLNGFATVWSFNISRQLILRRAKRSRRLPAGFPAVWPEIDGPARRWLLRQELIDDQGWLTIPVLGRFLIEAELA